VRHDGVRDRTGNDRGEIQRKRNGVRDSLICGVGNSLMCER